MHYAAKHNTGGARVLICLYFLNYVFDSYETYRQLQSGPQIGAGGSSGRLVDDIDRASISFPWLGVLVILPAAVLAATGVQQLICASILTIEMLREDAWLTWVQLVNILR